MKDFFEELREKLGHSPLTTEEAADIAESEWEEFLEEGMRPAGAVMRFLCEWDTMLKNPENKAAALSKLLELARDAEPFDAEAVERLEKALAPGKSLYDRLREQHDLPPIGPKEIEAAAEGDWEEYVLEIGMHPGAATRRSLEEFGDHLKKPENKIAALSKLLELNRVAENPHLETIEWLELLLKKEGK